MKYIRLAIVVLAVFLITACSNNAEQNQSTSQPSEPDNVGEFEAIDHNGEAFNVKDLQGQWWVADFIFTNCTTVCLPMTANMKSLQDKLDSEGLENVKLVSFSVDPDRDTPEVLTEYAAEYGADLERWTFVTGYDFETIREYAIGTFKNLVEAPPEGSDQVTHGTYFFLVDPEGNIVKNYSGTKAEEMEQIVADIKELQ